MVTGANVAWWRPGPSPSELISNLILMRYEAELVVNNPEFQRVRVERTGRTNFQETVIYNSRPSIDMSVFRAVSALLMNYLSYPYDR